MLAFKLLTCLVCIVMTLSPLSPVLPKPGMSAFSGAVETATSPGPLTIAQPGERPSAASNPQVANQLHTLYLPATFVNKNDGWGMITPAGGTVHSSKGEVSVVFGAGAVEEPVSVTFTNISAQSSQYLSKSEYSLAGPIFSIEAETESGRTVSDFQPASTSYPGTNSAGASTTMVDVLPGVVIRFYMPELPASADAARARIHYWDAVNQTWVPMVSKWNAGQTWISAATDHFSVFAVLAPPQAAAVPYLIIDPDHGGSDIQGVITFPAEYAAEEKILNLQLSQSLKTMLEESCDLTVDLTRTDNSTVSKPDRADFINTRQPDLSVTVAVNALHTYMANTPLTGSGPEAWIKQTSLNADWASKMLVSIKTQTDLDSRGVKNAADWAGVGLYLPLHVDDAIPHAQIEVAFMDNYYDRAILDDHPEWFVEALYNAVIQQLGLSGTDGSCKPKDPSPLRQLYRRVYGFPYWLSGANGGRGTGYAGIAGDPVFAPVGNVVHQQQDLFVAGPGLPWEVERTYNSLDGLCENVFGCAWSSNLDSFLFINENGEVDWRLPDGQAFIFIPQGDGTYTSEPGVRHQLKKEGDAYKITFPDQTVWEFDAGGYLVRMFDPNGNAIAFAYGAEGQLLTATSTTGHVYTFEHALGGKLITAIADEENHKAVYAYEENRLVSATSLNGDTTTYTYLSRDGLTLLTSVTDPLDDTYVFFEYDEKNRAVIQRDAASGEVKFRYDADAQVTTVTDALGNETQYAFDALYRPYKITRADGKSEIYEYDTGYDLVKYTDPNGYATEREFDERGNLTQKSDSMGHKVRYTYDGANNLTSETDNLGSVTTYAHDEKGNLTGYQDPLGNSVSISYNPQGQPVSLVDSRGNALVMTYDSNGYIASVTDGLGNVTRYVNDAFGRQLQITDANGHTVQKTYDARGNVLTTTDAKGSTWSFVYDGNQNLQQITDPLGRAWIYTYNDAGLLEDLQDPLGGHTRNTYDLNGKLLSQTDANGHVTSYAYDILGQLVEEHHPDGGVTRYEYDAAGRVTKITDAEGNASSFAYDSAGQVSAIIDALGNKLQKFYDPLGRLVKEANALGYLSEYAYDPNGNLISIKDPYNQVTGYVYDAMGGLIEARSPDGAVTRYERDILGRLVATIDPLGYRTEYGYDNVGNLIWVKDRGGNISRFTYDENNNRVSAETPLGAKMVVSYDDVNRQVEIVDANNHATKYGYDLLDRLATITNAEGGLAQFTYDPVGNRLSQVDPLGGLTTFTYDPADNLVAKTDPLGFVESYTYDLMGNRTAQVDANGGVMQYHYDGLYRLVEQVDPLGYTYQIAYDALGNRISETDENGDVTFYEFDALNRMVKKTDGRGGVYQYAYDPMGRHVSAIDPLGNVSASAYDARGQLVKATDSLGYSVLFEYDPSQNLVATTNANGFTTAYAYDADGRMVKQTDAKGYDTVFQYDPVGNMVAVLDALGGKTEFAFDGLNRQVRLTDALNGLTLSTYDANSNLIEQADARGGLWQYAYDANGRLTASTNPLGYTTTFTYDALTNLLSVTDANNHIRLYRYDARGQLVETKTPLGFTSALRYDGAGNLVEQANPRGFVTHYSYDANDNRVKVTNALDGVWDYQYDLNNRLTAVTNPNGHTTQYGYDAVGNLVSETLPLGQATTFAYDGNRNRVQVTNAKGFSSQTTYDELDLVASTIDPLGHTTTFAYDPLQRLTARTDALGYTTRFEFDALSRLTGVADALNHITTYAYDPLGALTHVTDANGHVSTNEIDLLGQKLAEQNAIGSRWQYTYDPVGNLVERLDANAQLTRYAYDPDDRLTMRSYTDGRTDAFAYDENGNILQVDDPTGRLAAIYDGLDRLASIEKTGALMPGALQYHYDPAGNLTSLVYPDGKAVRYDYNENEWLTRTIDPSMAVTGYTYDPVGLPIQVTRPNGTQTETTYDADNLPVNILDSKPGGSTELISQHAYTYDAVHQVTHVRETFTRGSLVNTEKSYTYDAAGQLISVDEQPDFEQGSLVQTGYSYDAVGNRVRMVTNRPQKNGLVESRDITYTYDAANRLTTAGDQTYQYDANGNRVSRVEPNLLTGNPNDSYLTTYTYDGENRLASINGSRLSSNGKYQFDYASDFAYDAFGRRVEKGIVNQGARKALGYLYDGWTYKQVAEQNDPSSPLTTYYYRDEQQLLSRQDLQGGGAGMQYWYHYDALGSVVANSNQSGLSVHEYRYDEYGAILDINGRPQDSDNWADPHNHYLLTGKELDAESELVYFGSRYYDPAAGVWLSADSYRGNPNEPLTLNRYAYLTNNPTSYLDYYGFFKLGPLEISGSGVSFTTSALSFSVQSQNGGLSAKGAVDIGFIKGEAEANVAIRDGTLRADGRVEGSANLFGSTYTVNANGVLVASCGSGNGCYVDGAGRAKITKNGQTIFDRSGQFSVGYKAPIPRGGLLRKGMPLAPTPRSLLDEVNDRFNASEERIANDYLPSVQKFDFVESVRSTVEETWNSAVTWVQEHQDVVVKAALVVTAVIGTAALCVALPGVGCVVGAGLIAAASSYGSEVVDNVWEASGGTTAFDPSYLNWNTMAADVDWGKVAVDGVIGLGSAGIGTGAAALGGKVLSACTGAGATLCRYGVTAGAGFMEGSGTQALVNVLDDDPNTGILDPNVLWSGVQASAIATVAYGASNIRARNTSPTPTNQNAASGVRYANSDGTYSTSASGATWCTLGQTCAGGTIYGSDIPINGGDVDELVGDLYAQGNRNITVLSGTHGDEMGNLAAYHPFFDEDLALQVKYPGVKVLDVIETPVQQQLQGMTGCVVGAWCFSDRSILLNGAVQ